MTPSISEIRGRQNETTYLSPISEARFLINVRSTDRSPESKQWGDSLPAKQNVSLETCKMEDQINDELKVNLAYNFN